MATSGDSSTRSLVYGDLRIVDPCSDLSFEDDSTSIGSTTSRNNSRASHSSLKYPVLSQGNNDMESIDPMRTDITGRSVHRSTNAEREVNKIGMKRGAFPSTSSETALQRFRNIINRPKIKSLYRSTDPQSSTEFRLKRKMCPWVKTKASFRKRLKYHGFSNDGIDNDDDSIDCNFSNSVSTKPISFEVSSTKYQLDDRSFRIESSHPFTEKESFTFARGAYDNRRIYTNMFDGNEYDDSFHQERKAMEPLLTSKTIEHMGNVHFEDRNSTTCFQLAKIALSKMSTEKPENREPSNMDIDLSNAVVANQPWRSHPRIWTIIPFSPGTIRTSSLFCRSLLLSIVVVCQETPWAEIAPTTHTGGENRALSKPTELNLNRPTTILKTMGSSLITTAVS
jgi:hypothetical protein